MALPIGVLAVFGALIVWAGLLVRGIRTGTFRAFLIFGIALMLWLNMGYLINGAPRAIASFVGIYDVLINVGLSDPSNTAAIAPCVDNACTVWGDRYVDHPAWGAAFYDRFANGPEFRSTLLYGHITLNSLVFVMMHVQLWKPGFGASKNMHRLLGRVSFVCLTLSLICAVWLASEHDGVAAYGGSAAEYGFYSMAAVVYLCAVMGIVTIRSGDTTGHRIWMFRFIGSMWGAFWLFRVVLFVIDPLLRETEAIAILIVIWGSAPVGVLMGDMVRRRLDAPKRGAVLAA